MKERLIKTCDYDFVFDNFFRDNLIAELEAEFERQIEKFWHQTDLTLPDWYGNLAEEVGEVAKAMNEKDYDNIGHELKQVIAVAIRMIVQFGFDFKKPIAEDMK